ncbi:hypothetical protein L6V77_20270 [Myxococcota bacterium]|nr:hypothetical protein [Myxococcota bacterium]
MNADALTPTAAPSKSPGFIARWLRLSPPDAAVARWHVSPVVDALAYHWGWLFALVPALLVGGPERNWWPLLVFVLGVNFSHRLLTLPYVYLDSAVFRAHPWKFTIFPGLMLVCIALCPWVEKSLPGGRTVIGVAAGLSAAWNLWHVLMQKYGLLRLYAAKSGLPDAARTPAWVDRLLVFAPLPALLGWVGPENRDAVARYFKSGRSFMPTVIDGLLAARPVLLGFGFALVAAAVFLWLRAEWRGNRLRSTPRLGMAAGTTLLAGVFFVVDPIKAYLAYGFSHALEYTVFVWAVQRKRYHAPLAHRPLLGRLLSRPALFYAVVLIGLAAFYSLSKWWNDYFFPGAPEPMWAGTPAVRWVFYIAIFQSMTHFYFDGFLWKMRLPEVRAQL